MPWVLFFMFMQTANESIIQLLAPVMADFYAVTKVKISILMTVSGVVSGLVGMMVMVLTDRFSMRQMFVFGAILFSVGTVGCYLVHPWFVPLAFARLAQVIGVVSAAGCFIVLVRYAPENKQSGYYALSSAIFLLAAGLGILTGALITDYLSWKYALLLPLLTLIALPKFMANMPAERRMSGKFDYTGALLVAAGFASVLLANTLQNIYFLVAAVVAVGTYVHYARNREEPFLDLALLRIRGLKGTYVAAFLLFGILNTVLFLLPFIIREVYGLSIVQMGLLFFSAYAPSFVSAMLTDRIVKVIGAANTFYLGWLLYFASLLLFATCVGSSLYLLWAAIFLFALGYPFLFTGMVTAAANLLPVRKLSSGMGIFVMTMGGGSSLFVSTVSLLLTNRLLDFSLLPFIGNLYAARSYSNVFLLLSICFGVSGLLYYRIHGGRRRAAVVQ